MVPTRFLLQPLIFLEITHALAAEPCLFLQSFGGVQQGDLARHSRVAWEIRAVARSLMCSRDSKKTHYFTSSDPHCDRLCCHSFWHLMWKHTFWHSSLAFYLTFNSDILYWHSIRPVYLAFFLGIHSDVLFWHSIQHLFWPSLWHWALPDLRERQIPVLTYQSNIPMAAASTAPEVPEFRGIAWGWLHLPLRDTRVGSVLYNPYRTHIIPNINDDISCILNTHTHIYIYIYIIHSYIYIYNCFFLTRVLSGMHPQVITPSMQCNNIRVREFYEKTRGFWATIMRGCIPKCPSNIFVGTDIAPSSRPR